MKPLILQPKLFIATNFVNIHQTPELAVSRPHLICKPSNSDRYSGGRGVTFTEVMTGLRLNGLRDVSW